MNSIYEIGTPVYLPEDESELPSLLTGCFDAFTAPLLAAIEEFLGTPSREGFLELEEHTLRILMLVSSHVVAGVVALLHHQDAWVEATLAEARESAERRPRHRGNRETSVRFLGGARLTLTTPYMSEDRSGRPGRKRGIGHRGPAGGGCYPVLVALGIMYRATPALASEVAKQTLRTASFDEAKEALSERGILLNKKTVRSLALHLGGEALQQRDARIKAAAQGRVLSDEFVGKRVFVSTDGGRIRLREGGLSGRRGKKGHRRYRTPWREPKLVMAYTLDDKGQRLGGSVPLYDATLGGADAAFEILLAELKLRGAAKATMIVLAADGAPWIWNRAADLASALGLDSDKIVLVADFYHAVEHLTDLADLMASWTTDQKKKWVRRMRRHLKAGRVETVIKAGLDHRRGRNAKKIGKEVAYFEERRELMRYDEFRQRGIPLGSGAVESAIRRVINLRLKGPSMFWRGPNAERMLHLRCYLKAGRWNELMRRVMYRSPSGEAGQDCALREAA